MFFTVQAISQVKWEPLFNGKNLKGWTKLNGTAEYKIVDGTIVGISKMNTPNTFLATKKLYGDFILEFEFKVEDGLNSGVQFRSNSVKTFKDGRVHGYQFEIDPSKRAWTGGVYDEARRGWLYTLTGYPAAQGAFKNGAWNKARIEAIGQVIRTWVNGVPCSNVVDTELNQGKGSSIGCEFQILDDKKHPDAKLGIAGSRTLGSLYDLIAAPADKPYRNNFFNNARIVVKDSKVEHWLNNVKIVEYERGTQMWRSLVAYSKYAKWPAFGEAAEGHILLQDHGDEVWFQNIKIKELP